MSYSKNLKNDKNSRKRHTKNEQQHQNQVHVTKAIQNLEYPAHLGELNYISIGNLQTNIQDQIINQAYYQLIMQNQDQFTNKNILHITEGINCLFSIFAARAGAKKIYCVIKEKNKRQTQNIFMMRQILKENRLQDVIQVLLWKDFNALVDVIIAQPMGYYLHFDGHLERVIEARDKFLIKNGRIFPNTLSFKCAAIHDQQFSENKVDCWDDVYGIPMTSMKKWIYHQPLIRTVDPLLIVSKPAKIITFRLEQVTMDEIKKIDRQFQIDLLGPCNANGILCWFQAHFGDITEKKEIIGSPWMQSTKYTQVTLHWPWVLPFKDGGKLRIRLKGHRNEKEGFTLLSTQVNGQSYQYSFS